MAIFWLQIGIFRNNPPAALPRRAGCGGYFDRGLGSLAADGRRSSARGEEEEMEGE